MNNEAVLLQTTEEKHFIPLVTTNNKEEDHQTQLDVGFSLRKPYRHHLIDQPHLERTLYLMGPISATFNARHSISMNDSKIINSQNNNIILTDHEYIVHNIIIDLDRLSAATDGPRTHQSTPLMTAETTATSTDHFQIQTPE